MDLEANRKQPGTAGVQGNRPARLGALLRRPSGQRLDLRARRLTRLPKIVGGLQIEPELRVHAEPVAEPERGVAGYAALPATICVIRLAGTRSCRASSVAVSPSVSSSSFRISPGCVEGRAMGDLLMTIHDLNIREAGAAFRPLEADAPLPVDADAVLGHPVALRHFEVVAGQRAQIREARGGVEDIEPLAGLPFDGLKGRAARRAQKLPCACPGSRGSWTEFTIAVRCTSSIQAAP